MFNLSTKASNPVGNAVNVIGTKVKTCEELRRTLNKTLLPSVSEEHIFGQQIRIKNYVLLSRNIVILVIL